MKWVKFWKFNVYAVQQDTQSDFNEWDYTSRMLARHVSDLIGPSSGAFCTSCYGWTCRVVRTVVPHTTVCKYSLYKKLLMMDRWGPKHVELTKALNKTHSLNHIVYLVGLHIYYKMIHGPYNIKSESVFTVTTSKWDSWPRSVQYTGKNLAVNEEP